MSWEGENGEGKALDYLERRGWILCPDWTWRWADCDVHREPTSAEENAMLWLIHEWDYGGYEI